MAMPKSKNDLSPVEIIHAYNRVHAWEGLTLPEIEQAIPDPVPAPLKAELMEEFKKIIHSDPGEGADPTRIDRWGETLQAAQLVRKKLNPYFEKKIEENDMAIYVQEIALKEMEKRRGEILKSLGAKDIDHPFVKALGKYGPLRFIDSMRGIEVFDQLAEIISEDAPELLQDRKLTVLYPASGSHLAPLLTVFRLIDADKIDTAKLTYTEINPVYLRRLEIQIRILRTLGVIEDFTFPDPQEFSDGGSETNLEINYKCKKIVLNFALGRSPDSYYRREYARDADLVIFHDTEGKSGELLRGLKEEKKSEQFSRSQWVLLEGKERRSGDYTFSSGLPRQEIDGQYGHCDSNIPLRFPKLGIEIENCFYKSAQWVKLP